MIYHEGTGYMGFMNPPHEMVMIASEYGDPDTLQLAVENITQPGIVPRWMILDKQTVSELKNYLEGWEKKHNV